MGTRPASPTIVHGPARGVLRRWRVATATAASKAASLGVPVVAWITLPGPGIDPVGAHDRLRGLDARAMLWARPDDAFALVGLGAAWEFSQAGADRFAAARDAWRVLMRDALTPAQAGAPSAGDLPMDGPIAMGGFAFSATPGRDNLWREFAPASLVVPHLTLAATGAATWITLAAVLGPDGVEGLPGTDRPLALLAAVERIANDVAPSTPLGSNAHDGPPAAVLEEFPPAAAWKAAVGAASGAVRARRLAKVVLARGVRVGGTEVDPAAALRRLRAGYPSCTLFAVERGGRCFLGATPERLARVGAGGVCTMALAGSAPRGATPGDDEAIGAALLASAKDRVEHALVVEAMREALAEMCTTLDVPDEPSLLRVSNVQHLCTPLTGTLRDGVSVLDVVGGIHPTPAVGGVPREAALAWIDEHEGFDRGWYAGPVGWVDRRGDGEFAVALRCALTGGDDAVLFSGCGIVADSDPDAEYAESALKLRPMLSALGANGTR